MKKFLTCVAMAMLLVGCAKEYDDSGLRELINGLDTRITALESNVQALQSAIGEGVFVAKVQEYVDPDTGKTIGVTVTYTSGDVKYFEITPQEDYEGPVLGVIKNGAGQLVWAIDGIAIMVDDEYVTVYQTPVFSIDDDGNLWVSIDGQDPVNLGPVTSGGATLEDGIFTDIKVLDDKIVLTLSDNSTVSIPFAEAFKLVIEASEVPYSDLKPITIPYTVTAKTAGTVVDVIGYNPLDFNVEVDEENIVITPLKYEVAAKMMAYADSRIGLTSIVALCVEPEGVTIVDTPWSAEFDYIAAGEDGTVTAHVVSNVEFVAKPEQDWVHVVEVKGTLHTISIVLDDNPTLEEREGDVTIYKKDDQSATGIMQIITICQGPGSPAETGPANLSKKQSANSYLVYAPGEYKFKPVKGNSDESVGTVASVEILWETINTDVAPAANSIIASVSFDEDFIYFDTPEILTPGNALIAAKDAAGDILWSWHIWIPADEIQVGFEDVYAGGLMDRNLGALVVATADANLSVLSYGLIYQWGRKDPFVGAGTLTGNANAAVAGIACSVTEGDGTTDAAKISLEQSIKNPTLMGRSNSGDWIIPSDNTLWVDEEKTIYDPCPPGYRVPARDKTQLLFSDDLSTVTGWAFSLDEHWWKLGSGIVFPYAGYRDDYTMDLAYGGKRAHIWSAHNSNDITAYMLNMRADKGVAALSSSGKARGGSVRCVVFDASAIVPPTPTPGPEPGDDTIDLSKDATANSYIVAAAGDYKFKAVKGNSAEAVGTVASVEIVWETENTATAPEANSIIAKVGVDGDYITFSTPETLKPGNALIAAKDGEGTILWSWHIWIPKDAVSATDLTDFIGGSMMNMNLGALEVVPATGSATIESLGLLYQWGRKDPFTGASEWANYPKKAAVTPETAAWVKSEGKVSIEEAIKNPTILYYDADHNDDHDWNSTSDANLWDNEGKKTIYDPCPVGYKVPVKAGSIFNKTDEGWNFDVENHVCEYTSNGVRIPLAGYVECYGGSLYGAGGGAEHAYVWSATHHDTQRGECLYVRTSKDPGSKYYKAYRGKGNAASVRCIAE